MEKLENVEKINLWKNGETPLFNKEYNQPETCIAPYIVPNSKTCIVVCAGGGYSGRAKHEGEGYAEWFTENGISAFVVDYRVAPYKYPAPQWDLMRAIRYARKCGYEKIGIIGSSAGGHLVGSVGTATDEMGYTPMDELDNFSCKPDFMILCYPVVATNEFAHLGSRINLLGEVSDEEAEKFAVHKRVTKATPPAFIWHTAQDSCVPVENSLMLAAAMSENKIPFELHIYEKGEHGLGLAEKLEGTKEWSNALLKWLVINNLK